MNQEKFFEKVAEEKRREKRDHLLTDFKDLIWKLSYPTLCWIHDLVMKARGLK